MKTKIKYELNKCRDYYRLYIITETYDEINKTGGCGCDVIMAGTREQCLKKKEELENEKNKKNRK